MRFIEYSVRLAEDFKEYWIEINARQRYGVEIFIESLVEWLGKRRD